jgi:hypothetical protein
MRPLDQRRDKMIRRLAVHGALIACFATTALAQSGAPARAPQAQPTRPPAFFSEGWKALSTPPDDHGAWPASQAGVASSNLELQLHGPSAKEIQLVSVRGSADLYPLNLWTGTTTSPSAATLRDRNRFVDLSNPLAKIRWVVRTSGFHQIRPVLKLADGTWLVGDRTTGPFSDFNQADVTIADVRWLKLDIDRVVSVGNWVEHPDLRKVDSIGFVDLLPGSGHGPGGYVNVGRIEVYGDAVKR